VSFELRKGEVHAIAGENGAGKSTLMNVIDGIVRPDSGEIRFDGQQVNITSPAVAQRLGIGFVHQEIALCPDISVAENIFMATTNVSRAPLMNYTRLAENAADVLRRLGDIDPTALVRSLSISQQQLVEIAKALTLDCRVLILDEPTAALTEKEAQILFDIMRKLVSQGISIIYISHRMVEIFDNCDRVSVFRDGQYITTRNVAETTPTEIVNAMVGRVIERGLAADGRLTRFVTTVSDRPGGLARLTNTLAAEGASVKDIFHDRAFATSDLATVDVSCIVETSGPKHVERLFEALAREGFDVQVQHGRADRPAPPRVS